MNVFSQQNFLDPDSEFRPLQIIHRFDMCLTDPEALTGEEGIDNRLDFLKSIGMGGVVCNVGFRDYLQSERQWEIWDEGVRRAADRDMILWWYDEKGYPSGTAGGLVTRADPTLAALGLACYTFTVAGPKPFEVDLPLSCLRFEAAFASKDFVAAAPDDVIDLSDHVDNAGRLEWDAPEGDWTILYVAQRYMYEGTHSAANVCEFKHYVNLLEPEATERFLRVTHEQYFRRTPPEIWKRIRAVFTDEPSLMVGYCGPLPERYQGKVPVIDAPHIQSTAPWPCRGRRGSRRPFARERDTMSRRWRGVSTAAKMRPRGRCVMTTTKWSPTCTPTASTGRPGSGVTTTASPSPAT